uniref:Uncharacterized protein n=1 Tax=Magallana gigas TaxID=29159 RepID=K1QD52_MAGGI
MEWNNTMSMLKYNRLLHKSNTYEKITRETKRLKSTSKGKIDTRVYCHHIKCF